MIKQGYIITSSAHSNIWRRQILDEQALLPGVLLSTNNLHIGHYYGWRSLRDIGDGDTPQSISNPRVGSNIFSYHTTIMYV